MSEELRAGNVMPLHADKYTLVECRVCRELRPYDRSENHIAFIEGGKTVEASICLFCCEDGCPLCSESLIDGTPLVIDNVPERRACHADCVVSARRQAEEDR